MSQDRQNQEELRQDSQEVKQIVVKREKGGKVKLSSGSTHIVKVKFEDFDFSV